MANQPTIVAASLDDSQMKQSIANLVASVKRATNTITKDFDSAVDHINAKLKELGTGSTASAKGGGSANTTKQSTQAVEENTDAIKRNAQAVSAAAAAASQQAATADKQIKKNQELSMSFDQMAKAQQQAVAPKSARESYLAFMKGYKEQARQLEPLISQAQRMMDAAVAKHSESIRYLTQRLGEAKQKLNELNSLRSQVTNYEGSGLNIGSTQGKKLDTQIEQQLRKIKELEEQISRKSSEMVSPELAQRLEALRAKHSHLSEMMKEVAVTSQQQLNTESKKTAEIEKQAKAIRESKDWNTKGSVLVNDRVYYNPEKVKGVKSLEEQILQTIKDQEVAEIRKASAAQSAAAAQQTEVQQSKAILDTETRITEEINKRKRYSSPDMQVGYDVTRDKLAQIIAGKNNIQANQVVNWDEQTSSVKTLSAALKQYQDTYAKMSAIERNSPFGKQIISDIQVLERNIQKVGREMSRPLNFSSAMAGSERTLDDIALKMQRLRAYKQGIDPAKKGADTEIRQINNELARLQKTADNWMGKQEEMIKKNTALGRSWNYMKNRLAFYFTVGASTQFVKQLIDVRSQYEMNERALGILIDSAERGTRIFNELSQMSLVSPYTLIELSTAAKQLSAYDIAAKDVVDTTRRLADMAAAVGIPIERLTYALGQIKAYGYLNSRDARMFSNAGIPLVKQLAEYYTQLEGRMVSTADVYDRIKKKTVDFEEVVNVIHHMTDEGGKFFDFQAKMADTLKVRLANLGLAWNNMLNDIGEENEGFLRGGIGVLRDLFASWKEIKHYVEEAVVAFGAYKVVQLLIAQTTGVAARSMTAEILAMKRSEVEILRKKALTQQLTESERTMIATSKTVTSTDYQNALSTKNLTKQKALLLAAFNMNNKAMITALMRMGFLTAAEVRNMTVGKAMTVVFKSMGLAIASAARAIGAFLASNWVFILIGAAYELYHAFDSASEHVKDINRGLIEDAKNTFKDLKEFLDSVTPIRVKIKAGTLDNAEAQKAWDELRERIETLTPNSAVYLSKLMSEEDINKRLEDGYKVIEMLTHVEGVVKNLREDAIKADETKWGGLLGKGLQDHIKDNLKFLDQLIEKYGSLEAAQQKIKGFKLDFVWVSDDQMEKFVGSVAEAALGDNLSIEEQREFLEKTIQKVATESKLSAEETRVFRINAERSYYMELDRQRKKGANIDMKAAYQEFYMRKNLQQEFFTWLSEVHSSETQKRISNASEEEIKNGEWLTEENKRWIKERAKEFSDKYRVSFNELNGLVQEANTWSIYIPVYFQTAKDSLSEFQADFYKRAKETFAQDKETAKQIFAGILPEKDDVFPKWVKDRQESIKKLGEDRKKYERDETEWSKQHIKDIDEQIKHNKEALDLYHQPYEESKDKKNKKQKDPILEALKLEISLVEKLRADYEKLTKAGESQAGALETIHDAYGKTIKQLNAELKSFKLPQLDIAKIITGKDPKKQLDHFKKTLNALVKNGLLNMERSKEVEAIIEKLKVSAKEYDFTELSKGIEKELGKLKEKIELGAALDAEPQLGNLFAQMYGFNSKELPRTFSEIVEEAQYIINKAFHGRKKVSVDIEAILDKDAFEKWAKGSGKELDSTLVQSVQKVRDYLVETQRKMISDTSKEYDRLMERYSEYQFKLIKIDKDSAADRLALIRKFAKEQDFLYVRDAAEIANKITLSTDPEERERLSKELQEIVKQVADGNEAVIQIGIGIDNKEAAEKAQVAFDEFTKNPEWKTAIGDLEGMTHDALRMLIKDLEDFIKTNKKLTPKQINQVEKTISKLHKQIRKNNPFLGIADAIEEAENRVNDYEDEITKLSEELSRLELIPEYKRSEDQKKRIDDLTKSIKRMKKEMQEVGKIDVSVLVGHINTAIGSISEITSSITKMLDAIGGEKATEASKTISDITGNLEAAGRGAQVGSAFGGWGAAIGAIAGGLTDLVTRFADAWSGNELITESVAESERALKRLAQSYNLLENAMKDAFGQGELRAKKLAIANKELQLSELENQLKLEKSRKEKNRDEDKIIDLQGQIDDLKNEMKELVEEVAESFLGISSVKDAVSSMVDNIISSLKSGENAMDKFTESWEDMCWNMIKQVVSTEILAPKFKKIFDEIDKEVNERGKDLTEQIAKKRADVENKDSSRRYYYDPYLGRIVQTWGEMTIYDENNKPYKNIERTYEEWAAQENKTIEAMEQALAEATAWTTDDLVKYSERLKGLQDDYELTVDTTEEIARQLGLTMGDKSQALSALQAGIQGITEDTANALEAYMNGVSQQVYAHTALLTEIRDAVVAFSGDVALGVQSQMLLQLQSSYQTQQAIQHILEGVLIPSGRAFAVELMN